MTAQPHRPSSPISKRIAMPAPVRRPGSANWYYRGTIPKEIRVRIAALPKAQRPRGWYPSTGDIWISLRTPDRQLAKSRYVEVAVQVARELAAFSQPERSLTKEDRVALAGEVYRKVIASYGVEPGNPVLWEIMGELWRRRSARAILDGEAYDSDEPFRADDSDRELGDLNVSAIDQMTSSYVDAVLREKGLAIDKRSRDLLIAEAHRALHKAFNRTEALAKSDYAPDTNLARFPSWSEEAPQPSVPPAAPKPVRTAKGVTLTQLLEGWAAASSRRPLTIDAFGLAVRELKKHLGHEDVSRITVEDIISWRDAMLRSGKLSPKTINEKRLTVISALINWGLNKNNRLLTGENVASGIRAEDKSPQQRSKGFRNEEARMILRAALAEKHPVRRWVPWVLAYTGARVNEITQLRRGDVRLDRETQIWYLEITPEAGSVKTNKPRIIPIHSDLLRQGFVKDFVAKVDIGPLFYDPNRPGRRRPTIRRKGAPPVPTTTKRSRAESAGNKLSSWVRAIGLDDHRIQPNHAWRHWFITRCREYGVDSEARYFMVGHTQGGKSDVGNEYGDASLVALKRELEKIPAFKVGD